METQAQTSIDECDHDEPTGIEAWARFFARGYVIAGGLFWMIGAFAGPYVYKHMTAGDSALVAMWPFLAAAVILIIGWTYERLAAVLLFGASTAVAVYGVLYSWEIGVWMIMSAVLIAPMIIAGLLFLVAARAETRRASDAMAQREAEARSFVPTRSMRVRARAR
jgi:hypothetical protein